MNLKSTQNPRACLAILIFATFLSGCGGSSGSTPPPPAGGFSNASLNGQYAFSMSGEDLNGGYVARVGSFAADGKGTITAGLEDMIDGNSPPSEITFIGGTYTIHSNGRGVLTLQGSTGTALELSLTLISASQGAMIETDLNFSSTGAFALQTPSNFSANALNGNYVFDFSGVSFSGSQPLPLSIVGAVALNGNGVVTGGTLDENTGTPSGPLAAQPGIYQLDTNGNGSNFGRGTMSFGGRSFAFYIVNSSRIKVVEEDQGTILAATAGDAAQQSGAVPAQNSAFNGSFVYLVNGASVLGTQGADARVARFTADGNGGLAAISFDENNNGKTRHISQGSNISNANYAIDTANAGSGRGTFTFTDSGGGTYSYIFYLLSSTQAVVQDISPGIVADGPMQIQTGSPFTNTSIAGSYAFSWNGTLLGTQNAIPVSEDFVGQYDLSSDTSSNIAGLTDYTQLSLSGNILFSDVALAGSLTVDPDGTNDNKFRVVNNSSPSTTFNFALYFVNADTSYMVCTDSIRVSAGVATQQTQ
jgi:hypothetical protein